MRRLDREIAGVSAAALTGVGLALVQALVERPMLMAERFVPGLGWAEVAALSVYAFAIARLMMNPARSARVRVWIWRVFSAAFFGQLLLGLAGSTVFLMTGKLHLPVPALIVAGPLYRGGHFFMPVLFAVTVLMVGPAWCSHLCYLGAWDDAASRTRKKPGRMPAWRRWMQAGMLGAIAGSAVAARIARVPPEWAAAAAGLFGLAGVGIMLTWSRATGSMTHCTTWCPIGALATVLGRASPFRIRIGKSCTDCGLCRLACRYDALGKADIERRRPASSCTLCGDCVGRCEESAIGYGLAGLRPERARAVFVVLCTALHAMFLGIARI